MVFLDFFLHLGKVMRFRETVSSVLTSILNSVRIVIKYLYL